MQYFVLKLETNGLIGVDSFVSILQVCITNLSSKIVFSKLYSLEEGHELKQEAQQYNDIRESDLVGCSSFTLSEFNKFLKTLSANSQVSLLVTSSEFYSAVFKQYGTLLKKVKLVDIGKLCAEKLCKTKSYYRNVYIPDRGYNGCLNIVEYLRDYNILDEQIFFDEELISLDF